MEQLFDLLDEESLEFDGYKEIIKCLAIPLRQTGIFRYPKHRDLLTHALLYTTHDDFIDVFDQYQFAKHFRDKATERTCFELVLHTYYAFVKRNHMSGEFIEAYIEAYETALPLMTITDSEVDVKIHNTPSAREELSSVVVNIPDNAELEDESEPALQTFQLVDNNLLCVPVIESPPVLPRRTFQEARSNGYYTFTVVKGRCSYERSYVVDEWYRNFHVIRPVLELDVGNGVVFYRTRNSTWLATLLYFSSGQLFGLVPGYLVVTRKHARVATLSALSAAVLIGYAVKLAISSRQ